ncbi:MAG: PEP/pyruvate-binding domain-containing protein [Ardenticatenaceae bacterium]|nr:PEP/pyruvate-binding domain-containing protein [Ardenticatenaceae bacterium]MCB8988143.1 PEP/pyruvate-binding domain-containing protein [Ardenticatenaceae bacterium]
MDTRPLRSVTPAIDIYIKLAQYPILCDKIRVMMRQELFRRGIIDQTEFEQLVRTRAIESQRREGLHDPYGQEESSIWQRRKDRVRDFLTDAYFANNLGSGLLTQLIEAALMDQPAPTRSVELTFNPEIAPWELLFRQGEIYEAMPLPEQEKVKHHLQEIKVVLIKRLISDQLPFIGVAKNAFTIADLRHIYRNRIGSGKIGGKAAGMLLARRILHQQDPELGPDISHWVDIPDSYFIGTEVIYDFRLMNRLDHFMNQKYRPLDEIRDMYPKIVAAHLEGEFPENIVDQLREVLSHLDNHPIVVRSSSLLEDSFGFSFAGKYETIFCPNQGTPEENLAHLLNAIRRVYASTLNPDAILYRRKNGMIDYDERMAVLIQPVQGHRNGRYFFPTLAGVGFSENPFRWHPKIRREDGFLRLVWGLGTRAVTRVANDYPRMIALSHPQLRPETDTQSIRQYSQWFIDVIDLEENTFTSLPIQQILDAHYPDLRFIASVDKGDYLQEMVSAASAGEADRFVLTFNFLARDRKFVRLMRTALRRLEDKYQRPVDVEFTVDIIPDYPYPNYKLNILQCRPLSQRVQGGIIEFPEDVSEEDTLFTANKLVPDGKAEGIRYIIYVDPILYRRMPDLVAKMELGRAIGRLNKLLEDEEFILIGPGRWGSVNLDLGVHVTYGDIYNTRVLIEVAEPAEGAGTEFSYGTHFFQDLVESGIHSLGLEIGNGDGYGRFNFDFFHQAPNVLSDFSPGDAGLAPYLHLIDLQTVNRTKRLNIIMDGSLDKAIGYLAEGDWSQTDAKGTVSIF